MDCHSWEGEYSSGHFVAFACREECFVVNLKPCHEAYLAGDLVACLVEGLAAFLGEGPVAYPDASLADEPS